MFQIERKGYNQKQVGEFVVKTNQIISDLRTKNAELNNEISFLQDEINKLKENQFQKEELVLKAVENENTHKQLCDFEVKKLNDLISSWGETLNKIRQKFGFVSEIEKQSVLFKHKLQEQTQKVIDFNFKPKQEKPADDKVYHKQLLNKMSGLLNNASQPNVVTEKISEIEKQEEEIKKLDENLIKNQSPKKESSEVKNYTNLVDKYLTDNNKDDIEIKGDGKEIVAQTSFFPEPNESGFDLKQAVNPKESLEDIMSDFDFYNPEENLKKKKKF